ncbi:hypothetical protein OROGR_032274 [Orobanche gracilis]
MKMINVGGTTKIQCNFCKRDYAWSNSGATSHHLRHIKKCRLKFARGKSGKKQQLLTYSKDACDGSVTNFTYDHAKVRELASHMLLVHEYSLSMFDHVVFNKFCKAISPLYRKITRLKELLNEILTSGVGSIKAMAVEMEKKFDKYWGECNILMSLAAILDPRYKFFLIDHAFPIIYGEKSPICIDQIKRDLRSLFNEYAESAITSQGEMSSSVTVKRKHSQDSGTSSLGAAKKVGVLTGREKFQMSLAETEAIQPRKSDLDTYLEESRYGCSVDVDFDVLDWWNTEKWRFPILSQMAGDILSIPVTTVASESTFSAGGRVIGDRRASLSVDTVQMLMQGNNWVRRLHGLKNKTRATEANLLKASNIEEVMLPEIDE